jgi:hypothetical protein
MTHSSRAREEISRNHRPALGSLTIFGIASLRSAVVGSLSMLGLLRFFTGSASAVVFRYGRVDWRLHTAPPTRADDYGHVYRGAPLIVPPKGQTGLSNGQNPISQNPSLNPHRFGRRRSDWPRKDRSFGDDQQNRVHHGSKARR